MPNPACLKSVNFSKLYNIVRLAEEFIWLATQEKLLREMVLVGEAALAHEYAVVNFGVDPGVLQLDPAELAADEAARAAVYLQLALPPEAVHFVDSAEGLAKAASQLLEAAAPGEAAVLGLDCEWETCTERSSSSSQQSAVSLLQVSLLSVAKGPELCAPCTAASVQAQT